METSRFLNRVLVVAVLLILLGFALVVRIGSTADRVVVLTTSGMAQNTCEARILSALLREKGVASVQIDQAGARVIVGFDSKKTGAVNLAAIVTQTGYPSKVLKNVTVEEYRIESGRMGREPVMSKTACGCEAEK